MTIRQIHSPGDLLPVRVTAEALRHLRLAAVSWSRHCSWIGRANRGGSPEVQRLYSYMGDQYMTLANEIAEVLDTVRSIDKFDEPNWPLEGPIIGQGLLDPRRAEFEKDIAELERRL